VKAVDTNGAGDMFAGAFLYAVTQGHTHAQAAWLANQAAGQVVSRYGNRLNTGEIAAVKAHYAQHLAA
jgi:sugar/nucleoside kinase (ribokinase family)